MRTTIAPLIPAKPRQMIDGEPLGDVERLQRRAAALETTAERLTRAYNRATWIRFLLVFIPVPFVVLLLRLYLDAWGYYVAGGLFIVCGAALFSLDSAASAKCDAATGRRRARRPSRRRGPRATPRRASGPYGLPSGGGSRAPISSGCSSTYSIQGPVSAKPLSRWPTSLTQ